MVLGVEENDCAATLLFSESVVMPGLGGPCATRNGRFREGDNDDNGIVAWCEWVTADEEDVVVSSGFWNDMLGGGGVRTGLETTRIPGGA